MRKGYLIKAVAALAICASAASLAGAWGVPAAHAAAMQSDPCRQGEKPCIRLLQDKIAKLRAYVVHVKPGDPVEFTTQPNPRGDHLQGAAVDGYRHLREELDNLKEWGASQSNFKFVPDIVGAQERLTDLSRAPNRRAALAALNALSRSVERLQNDLDNGRRRGKQFSRPRG
jgi:hypothetical protein